MAKRKRTSDLNADLLAKGRRRRSAIAGTAAAQRGPHRRRNDLLPSLQIELRPIDEIAPPERNVRRLDPAQRARVRSSIETLGLCQPLLIDENGSIVDGVVRHSVAEELGLTEVPCIQIGHLSPAERRTLRLAINRIQERGGWDLEALTLEFSELIELDAPIDVTGFDPPEIDLILHDDAPLPFEPGGPVDPDPKARPISQAGDVWALGPHLLACGDARDPDVHVRLFSGSVLARLILTDVPFNVPISGHVTRGAHREFAMASGEMSEADFAEFNGDWLQASLANLVDGGLVASFIDWRSVELLLSVGRALGLQLLNLIIWSKDNAGMGSLYRSQHELLPLWKHGTAAHRNNVELGRHGRHRSNVWTYPGASSMSADARRGLRYHPTVKPVALLEDALLDVTSRGDVVIDPFLGSGSTLIAAERTGRICRAIEIDPLYVDVAIRRWMAVTGGQPELVCGSPARPRRRALALPAPCLPTLRSRASR